MGIELVEDVIVTNDWLHEKGLSPDQELFPFQIHDVNKLLDLPGALIANEMGTGKTYEAIARDLALREQRKGLKNRTLVVAPLSVLGSWQEHFRELAPHLKVRVIDRKNRAAFLKNSDDVDVFLMHWEALQLMPQLRDLSWMHHIADECHKLKNRKNKWTKSLKRIRTTYKTGLTGTPMVNRPDELWSLIDWLYPGKAGSYWAFFERFCEFDIVYPHGYKQVTGPRNEKILKTVLSRFMVRHLKKEQCCDMHPEGVMPELPDKYYTSIWVDLGSKQRRAYDSMADDMLAWIGANENNPLVAPVVIARLIRLQQLALSFGDMKENHKGELVYYPMMPSAKIDALMEILEDTDEQVVVFSQFSKMIDLVEAQLNRKKISNVKLTGAVSTDNREANIRSFQAGRAKVFLATIGAGGVGITLHAASTAVFLDRSWSPADNFQAEDRLHRHGQENAVQIIDIMARNTVDLGRKARLEMKWGWIKAILD